MKSNHDVETATAWNKILNSRDVLFDYDTLRLI